MSEIWLWRLNWCMVQKGLLEDGSLFTEALGFPPPEGHTMKPIRLALYGVPSEAIWCE